MNPLQQIADNLSAAGLDHPAVDDAVIKLTNMAAHPSRGVVDDGMVERARLAYYETKKFTWNGQVMNPKECMKAGLEAALAATPAHDQPEGSGNE